MNRNKNRITVGIGTRVKLKESIKHATCLEGPSNIELKENSIHFVGKVNKMFKNDDGKWCYRIESGVIAHADDWEVI